MLNDDISGRIIRAAEGFEKMTELHPAMFEDVMDEELAKYDKYLVEMEEGARKVEEVLAEIKVRDRSLYSLGANAHV